MTPLQTIQQSAREFEEKFAEDKSGKNSIGVQYIDAPVNKLKSHILSSTIKLLQSQIEARTEMMKENKMPEYGRDSDPITPADLLKMGIYVRFEGYKSALQACNEADRELIKELQ